MYIFRGLLLLILLCSLAVEGSRRPFVDFPLAGRESLISHQAALYSIFQTPAQQTHRNAETYYKEQEPAVPSNRRTRQDPSVSGLHVLILNASELHSGTYGSWEVTPAGLQHHWCCTPELVERISHSLHLSLSGCSHPAQIGHLIVNNNHMNAPSPPANQSLPASLPAPQAHWYLSLDDLSLSAVRHAPHHSSFFYGFLVDCAAPEPDGAPSVLVSGEMSWMNPYGHLSGDLYPLYPFYGVLAFAHLLLALFWMVASVRHWENLLPLQSWVTALIAVGMLESLVWYFDYHSENTMGMPQLPLAVFALSLSAAKRALSRVVLVLVSSGYGLNRPFLNADSRRIIVIGACYGAFSTAAAIAQHLASRFHQQDAGRLAQALALPTALFDGLVFWWIFQAVAATLAELQKPHHGYKLRIFRRFVTGLKIAAAGSSAVLVYKAWLALTSAPDSVWELWWLEEAFWSIFIFAITILIAMLFNPASSYFRIYQESSAGASLSFSHSFLPLDVMNSNDKFF